MKSVDVVVATGGGAMVKSAYSSGKPSFGVGAGNVPVIIDRDVDIKDAVEQDRHRRVVRQRHHLLARAVRADAGRAATTRPSSRSTTRAKSGSPMTRSKFRSCATSCSRTGTSTRTSSAVARARSARWPASTFRRARGSSCCRPKGAGTDDVLAQGEALPGRRDPAVQDLPGSGRKAKANLLVEGAGHSAALHSNDESEHPRSRRRAADQPAGRQPGELADRRRLADERLRADDDARLRLVGRQLDLREPGLQAPDERLADRQGHHGQEGADRRGDLGLGVRVRARRPSGRRQPRAARREESACIDRPGPGLSVALRWRYLSRSLPTIPSRSTRTTRSSSGARSRRSSGRTRTSSSVCGPSATTASRRCGGSKAARSSCA